MKNKVSIKRNYIYNTLYQLLLLITPLITAPYVSRVLGAHGVGIYSYTNSIVMYFSLIAAMGTASYGQREIARHRNNKQESSKLFWEIEILSILTTGVATIAWVVWILISDKYTIYYVVLTFSLISAAFDISWYFGGFELFQYIVIRNTIVKLVGIAMLFIFIKSKNDTLLYVGINAVINFLGTLSMWTYLPKMLVPVKVNELKPLRHLKSTFTYFIPTIATSVYTILDKTMIGAITNSPKENGYYEQATKIISLSKAALFSLNTVMEARMSYLFMKGRYDEIKDKMEKSYDFLLGLSIPFMFGIIGIANNFVPWFFGKGYSKVVILMYCMSPLLPIITLSNIADHQYLTPVGQKVKSTIGIVSGAVANFILNATLIPRLGSVGATIGSVAAETIITIILVNFSKDVISWKGIIKVSWKKVIAAIVMVIPIYQMGLHANGSMIVTIIQIVLGAAIYVGILLLLRDSFVKAAFEEVQKTIIRR